MENWNKFLHVFLTGARSWSRRQNWSCPTTFEYNMNTLLWWWDAFFELDFSNLNRMKIGLPLIWFWLVATHVGSSESVYFFYFPWLILFVLLLFFSMFSFSKHSHGWNLWAGHYLGATWSEHCTSFHHLDANWRLWIWFFACLKQTQKFQFGVSNKRRQNYVSTVGVACCTNSWHWTPVCHPGTSADRYGR